MKSLLAGEKIIATFSTRSKFGGCIFSITNFGLDVENAKMGTVLNLSHDDVLSCLPINKHSIRIAWAEGQNVFEFIVQGDHPELLCAKYSQIKEDYVQLQKKIGLNSETNTQNITIQNPIVETKKRFVKIPNVVSDCHIWNDCWFDKTKNIYVTHNKFFKSWEDLKSRPHQIEYRIESKDDGIVILGQKVVFKFGLPAIRLPQNKGGVWFLLSTITANANNWEIEAARFAKDPEQRIDFTQSSENDIVGA